jgi:uncharacterized phage protein gp47/JayE
MAGLTKEGLLVKRLPEVLDSITESERINISSDINTQDNELLGQLNTIISSQVAELWSLLQAVNDNFNPLKAEGRNLDDMASIIGIVRKTATKSHTSTQLFTGKAEVNIEPGIILQNPVTKDRFITTDTVGITLKACRSGVVSVQYLLPNTDYSVTVNGKSYTFTSDNNPTEDEILSGLIALIDADTEATWSATSQETELTIASDTTANIAIDGLTRMLPALATCIGNVEAMAAGSISAPIGTVTEIVTGAAGLESTTNPDPYFLGSAYEEDEEFRQRIVISQQTAGAATFESVEDAIRNVEEVTHVDLRENTGLETDADGVPAKSFEAIVVGATDEEVAQAILENKAVGITAHGSTVLAATDSQGKGHLIGFTRPSNVNIAFDVQYNLYDEEVFPIDGEDLIKSSIKSTIDNYDVGEDIIPTRMIGPIYSGVPGIDSLTITIQQLTDPGDTPLTNAWQSTRQSVSIREIAATTLTDIYVSEV